MKNGNIPIESKNIDLYNTNFVIPNNFLHSRFNLVIGENGSGKTRFLRTIEQQKKESGNTNDNTLITLYFPEITSFFTNKTDENLNYNVDNKLDILDVLRGLEDINFQDFLKIVENADDRQFFIRELYKLKEINSRREKERAKKAIDTLNNTLRELLNREFILRNNIIYISRIYNEEETRYCSLEEAFSQNEMSPGELMLFYFVLFLYFIEATCKNKIILIIDEPEQHLHPQKQIMLVKRIMSCKQISELWIASHSLFLVPLFSYESLILISNNKIISKNSNLYFNIITSLLGEENFNILEFTSSLEDWQYYKFILECFCIPTVKDEAKKNDEQTVKAMKVINYNNNKEIKILDYGAGKCRFWNCLKLDFPEFDPKKCKINYFAYEPYPEKGYKYDIPNLLIKTKEDLMDKHKEFYDIIILMNVLHEIPVDEWENTFKTIYNILDNNGVLIMAEVKYLTQGERIFGNNGYIILNNEQVDILFEGNFVNTNEQTGITNLWAIDKKHVSNVSNTTIIKCLESLKRTTEYKLKKQYSIKLKQSKDSKVDEISARRYAFLSQQYINAKFALEKIKNKNNIVNRKFIITTNDIIPPPQLK